MAGTIIADRYEIRESIGSGQSGEVFRAYDRRLQREVAVKRLVGNLGDRETQIYSRLKTKYIVPLHDKVEEGGVSYLVFELMEHSLATYTEPLDVDTVLRWAEESLDALRDVHACGVTHRDIKPGNLFVDGRGSIRLGDFGVSARRAQTAADVGEKTLTVKGFTPEYMAPEIIQGDPEKVGANSDLYSLGFVVYRLLLGAGVMRRAFPQVYVSESMGGDLIQYRWMMWHTRTEDRAPDLYTLRPDVGKPAGAWVRKMVEKDPDFRFQTAGEAQEALRKAVGGSLIEAGGGETVPPPADVARPRLRTTQAEDAPGGAARGMDAAISLPRPVAAPDEGEGRRRRKRWRYAIGGGIVLVCGVALLLGWCDSGGSEGGASGEQSTVQSPQVMGKMVLLTDLACEVRVDGGPAVRLFENQTEEIAVAVGIRRVEGRTLDGQDVWGPRPFEVGENLIPTVVLQFKPLRELRLQREREK
ncbi:MAG: serine/threonine-protein kinase [Bacteroidota bacterium]